MYKYYILCTTSFWIKIYILGLKALQISGDEPYITHWPTKRGSLNLHPGPGGSLMSICADLEAIWGFAIQQCLDIPLQSLQVYIAYLLADNTIFSNQLF